jgi:charged multivesicular body protein 4
MDDIAEQNDVANEISQAISSGIALNPGLDDDDLLKELGELEQEELDKELINIGPSPSKLPDVPTELPSASKTKGESLNISRVL